MDLFQVSPYMNTLKMRIRKVRQKENIRVLFAVAETATWKNDTLYKAMLKHPQIYSFTPLILPDEQKGGKFVERRSRFMFLISFL